MGDTAALGSLWPSAAFIWREAQKLVGAPWWTALYSVRGAGEGPLGELPT